MAEDAARLYAQGWSIRQVAARFDVSYGVMRRILAKNVPFPSRGGGLPAGEEDE
jgi:transposase